MIPVWHAVNTAWGPLSFIESVEAWEVSVDRRLESSERKAKRREMIQIVQGDVPEMLENRYNEMVMIHAASLDDPRRSEDFQIAFDKFQNAMRYCSEHVMALHEKECGCGWTPENADIFKLPSPRQRFENWRAQMAHERAKGLTVSESVGETEDYAEN